MRVGPAFVMLKDILHMFSTSVVLRVLRLGINMLLISQLGRSCRAEHRTVENAA